MGCLSSVSQHLVEYHVMYFCSIYQMFYFFNKAMYYPTIEIIHYLHHLIMHHAV